VLLAALRRPGLSANHARGQGWVCRRRFRPSEAQFEGGGPPDLPAADDPARGVRHPPQARGRKSGASSATRPQAPAISGATAPISHQGAAARKLAIRKCPHAADVRSASAPPLTALVPRQFQADHGGWAPEAKWKLSRAQDASSRSGAVRVQGERPSSLLVSTTAQRRCTSPAAHGTNRTEAVERRGAATHHCKTAQERGGARPRAGPGAGAGRAGGVGHPRVLPNTNNRRGTKRNGRTPVLLPTREAEPATLTNIPPL